MQHLSAITHTWFGLIRVRSPLLTESLLFSLPVGTKMFHFPTFPPTALYIQAEVAGHNSGTFKVSLFGNPRITVWLPTPRGLSQVPTSFIGSWCLGIHRLHLVACLLTTKMLASTVKFSKYGRATNPQPTHRPATNQRPQKNRHPQATDPSDTQQRAQANNHPPTVPHPTKRSSTRTEEQPPALLVKLPQLTAHTTTNNTLTVMKQ